jgi:hypothetical protein
MRLAPYRTPASKAPDEAKINPKPLHTALNRIYP